MRGRAGLTASAELLSERIQHNATVEPGWQREIWDLYDVVPEIRTAARITGNTMSQCRLVLARVSDEGEPAPLDKDEEHPAKALLAQFAGGFGGQAALLDSLGVFLATIGEGIAVGSLDPGLARTDSFKQWAMYAPSDVKAQNKKIMVRLDQSSQTDREVEGDMEAVRIWRRNPRHNWESDSAMRSALPILREIALYDAHLQAAATSRLTGAGLLFIPEGMTLPGVAQEDGVEEDGDPFMLLLMQVAAAAIKDRASAAAMVPIVIRAEAEDISAVRWINFWTDFSSHVLELRTGAIDRLAVAVDMPAELLTGLGKTQHWTGSLISDQWVNSELTGLMTLACGSLTTGWLYPAMAEQATAAGQPMPAADVILWFDSSSVKTRPNETADAQELFDRKAIGPDALRRASMFDEGDAPSPTELYIMLLLDAVAADPTLLPQVVNALKLSPDPQAVVPVTPTGAAPPAASTSPAVPGAKEPSVNSGPAQPSAT